MDKTLFGLISMGGGVYLAHDIVHALRQIGLRAVFTTHMHELAAAAQEINEKTEGGSAVFSLVASKPDEAMQPDQVYSYRIQPGPPLGRSYTEHIAARYGISVEQLQSLLEKRNLLPGNQYSKRSYTATDKAAKQEIIGLVAKLNLPHRVASSTLITKSPSDSCPAELIKCPLLQHAIRYFSCFEPLHLFC